MKDDPKERRLQELRGRFKTIRQRHDFISAYRKWLRDWRVWTMVALGLAVLGLWSF